jgi:large subunit ribosomal protein L6
MSRIGKKPIQLPEGVSVRVQENEVQVKGPKGELKFSIPSEIELIVEEKQAVAKVKENSKQSNALWGLVRSLANNAVEGVINGFQKQLEIQGVGYRARIEEEELVLEVGFSHSVKIKKPQGIELLVEKNIITVSGIDKQLVGQTAAEIRKVKPPEPYKGKGIRYSGEQVRRKAGKKTATTTG